MTEWQPSFVHARTGYRSTSLRGIYRQCSDKERQWSVDFYDRYPTGHGTGLLTPFTGILQGGGPLANAKALVQQIRTGVRISGAAEESDLAARLMDALTNCFPDTTEIAVAVSGGVDCWLLAALLKGLGHRVCGWYLETGIPGYCEREQVERSSTALGIECRHIRVTAEDFVEALPEFTVVTQMPIYNLHPVSKWLLARGLRREGITALVTGDAADQVMRWDWDCDLLPLTVACFQGAGIRLVTPFMAAGVIQCCRQPDPNKQPVRKLAQQLGVPDVAKQPTLFPALLLPEQPRASLPAVPGYDRAGEDRKACLSYTSALLLQSLEDTHQCAG